MSKKEIKGFNNKEEFSDFLKNYAPFVIDHLFITSRKELEERKEVERLFNFFCKHLLLIQPNENYNLYSKKQKAWFNTVMSNLMLKHLSLVSGFTLETIKVYREEFKAIEKAFNETDIYKEEKAKRALFIYNIFTSLIGKHFKTFTDVVKEVKVK